MAAKTEKQALGPNPPLTITRPPPSAVTYDLHKPNITTITLPTFSTWSSGLHWHETHTEYLRVVKGYIRVRLGAQTHILGPTSPEVRVDRGVWHEWRRAEKGGEDVVVEERTDPADGEKAIFFWNLNGVILEAQKMGGDPGKVLRVFPARLRSLVLDWWTTLGLFVIFRALDNVPAFLDVPGFVDGLDLGLWRVGTIPGARRFLILVDYIFAHLVLWFSSWLGWALRVNPVRREFTPAEEYDQWWSKRRGFLRTKPKTQ